jgi:hypothetical protein
MDGEAPRQIYQKLKGTEPPEHPVACFIDPQSGEIIDIRPSTIVKQLGERFPFEPNIPRKVMRHLIRAAGMSHERAEVYMGHWWQAREPWSPFSGFDWPGYLRRLSSLLPGILDDLGFTWIPQGGVA